MSQLRLTTRAPDAILAKRGHGPVTVSRFLAEAAKLAESLPGRPWAVNLCRDRYRFMRAFAAVLLAGQTNLLPANRLDSTIRAVLADYSDAYVLSDEDTNAHWPVVADARLPSGPLAEPGPAPSIPGEHTAAMVFTSGSTGRARPLAKPWRTFHDSSRINAAEMGLAEGSVRHLVATVPPQHMYGLETSVLIPFFAPVVAAHSQPFTPADIRAALAAVEAPRVLISTPAHLRALAEPGLDLPPLQAVWSATGPLDTAIAARIEDQHHTRVSEIYGCSETGSLARRQPARDSTWTLFRGFHLEAEPDGRTRVAADHLPEAFVLQDRLEHQGPGRFQLIGRDEDLVNVAGKRGSLVDINLALLKIPGVEDGAIFEPASNPTGRTERLAALVVAPDLHAAEIRRALREYVDEAFLPRPIRHVERLPRAETGKLPRSALIAAFEATGADRQAR